MTVVILRATGPIVADVGIRSAGRHWRGESASNEATVRRIPCAVTGAPARLCSLWPRGGRRWGYNDETLYRAAGGRLGLFMAGALTVPAQAAVAPGCSLTAGKVALSPSTATRSVLARWVGIQCGIGPGGHGYTIGRTVGCNGGPAQRGSMTVLPARHGDRQPRRHQLPGCDRSAAALHARGVAAFLQLNYNMSTTLDDGSTGASVVLFSATTHCS